MLHGSVYYTTCYMAQCTILHATWLSVLYYMLHGSVYYTTCYMAQCTTLHATWLSVLYYMLHGSVYYNMCTHLHDAIILLNSSMCSNVLSHTTLNTSNIIIIRLCRSHNETTDHILNGCLKLSQTEYKARHDKVSAAVHWSLCKEYGFDHSSKWYEHRAEKVLGNDDVKLLWDFHVQSDHVIEHCRPDLLLVKKKIKEAIIIDIAVPGDIRITDKEQDKILKYQDLKREIKTVW